MRTDNLISTDEGREWCKRTHKLQMATHTISRYTRNSWWSFVSFGNRSIYIYIHIFVEALQYVYNNTEWLAVVWKSNTLNDFFLHLNKVYEPMYLATDMFTCVLLSLRFVYMGIVCICVPPLFFSLFVTDNHSFGETSSLSNYLLQYIYPSILQYIYL